MRSFRRTLHLVTLLLRRLPQLRTRIPLPNRNRRAHKGYLGEETRSDLLLRLSLLYPLILLAIQRLHLLHPALLQMVRLLATQRKEPQKSVVRPPYRLLNPLLPLELPRMLPMEVLASQGPDTSQ